MHSKTVSCTSTVFSEAVSYILLASVNLDLFRAGLALDLAAPDELAMAAFAFGFQSCIIAATAAEQVAAVAFVTAAVALPVFRTENAQLVIRIAIVRGTIQVDDLFGADRRLTLRLFLTSQTLLRSF